VRPDPCCLGSGRNSFKASSPAFLLCLQRTPEGGDAGVRQIFRVSSIDYSFSGKRYTRRPLGSIFHRLLWKRWGDPIIRTFPPTSIDRLCTPAPVHDVSIENLPRATRPSRSCILRFAYHTQFGRICWRLAQKLPCTLCIHRRTSREERGLRSIAFSLGTTFFPGHPLF